MAVGRRVERVPADEHGARLFLGVEPQQEIREADDRAAALVAAPADRFRHAVIGAMRERVAIDHEQRPVHIAFLVRNEVRGASSNRTRHRAMSMRVLICGGVRRRCDVGTCSRRVPGFRRAIFTTGTMLRGIRDGGLRCGRSADREELPQ